MKSASAALPWARLIAALLPGRGPLTFLNGVTFRYLRAFSLLRSRFSLLELARQDSRTTGLSGFEPEIARERETGAKAAATEAGGATATATAAAGAATATAGAGAGTAAGGAGAGAGIATGEWTLPHFS